MDSMIGGGYQNTPSPFQGVIRDILTNRRRKQEEEQRANAEHERMVQGQAMAHQLATDRMYHQGNIDSALVDQKARHASELSAQESRQRQGEARSMANTLRESGGGQPVRSMTVPGGSVSFGEEEEKKNRRRTRRTSPQQPSSITSPTQATPMSPQFSAPQSAHDAQSSEPRTSRSGF